MRGSGVVLNGTSTNCNGGRTPWGSWLSCEETTAGRGDGYEKPHGYVFEVPFDAKGPVEPAPIKAMGRFCHEAAVVDPRSGIVYMTEDNTDPADGFYRYVPDHRGRLHRGGKLEMLAVEGRSRYDTSRGQKVGRGLRCEWVTIPEPDPKDAEKNANAVFMQGRERGAAGFLALEGAMFSRGSVYFVASAGGDAEKGQIWRYTPNGRKHGTLTLLYESRGGRLLDEPDALTVSPRGAVLVCEDGDGEDQGGTNFLRALNPSGELITFARNDTPLDVHAFDDEAKRGRSGAASGRARATARTDAGCSSASSTRASRSRSPARGRRAGCRRRPRRRLRRRRAQSSSAPAVAACSGRGRRLERRPR